MSHETQGAILIGWLIMGLFVAYVKMFSVLEYAERHYRILPMWVHIANLVCTILAWPFPLFAAKAHRKFLKRFW